MLELRPVCEHCAKALPNGSPDAMICTFECTFCRDCVQNFLQNVCPNCGGGFERRPTRPAEKLENYPAGTKATVRPVVPESFAPLLQRYRAVAPERR
jgi:hypothetical protein